MESPANMQHLLNRNAVSTLAYTLSRNTNRFIDALNEFSQHVYWVRTARRSTDSDEHLRKFFGACQRLNSALDEASAVTLSRGVTVSNVFAALESVRASDKGDELLAPHKATLNAVTGWVYPAMSRVLTDIEWAMTNGFCIATLPDVIVHDEHSIAASNAARYTDPLLHKLEPMAEMFGLGEGRAFWWMRLGEERELVGVMRNVAAIDDSVLFFVSDAGHEWLDGVASVLLTDAFRESSHMAQRRMLATIGGALAEALDVPDYVTYRTTSLSSTKVMFMRAWATWFRHYRPHMTIVRDLSEVIPE